MAKKQKCPDCEPGLPGWLATFGDLMSLLLTFFVLLLSFSTTKQEDFENAIGAIQGSLGVLDGEPLLNNPIKMHIPITKGDIVNAKPVKESVKKEIEEEIQAEGQEENVEVIEGPDGIIVRIKDNVAFGSGKAAVKEDFKALLTRIGAVLNRMPNPIEIEGHTDAMPISNEEFANNHWLSNARAMKVLDLLVDEVGIDGARMSAVGYGEHRPLYPHDGPESSKNRRVEIKIRYSETDSDQADPETIRQLLQEDAFEVRENEQEKGE